MWLACRGVLVTVRRTCAQTSNEELAESALMTLEKYVSWIDIGLVANDTFVPLLCELLAHEGLRIPAIVCFREMVLKGACGAPRCAHGACASVGTALTVDFAARRVCRHGTPSQGAAHQAASTG